MRRDKFSWRNLIICASGLLPVGWIGLLIAPSLEGGLGSVLKNFGTVMSSPFSITFCKDSLKTVLLLWLIYAFGIAVYLGNDRNYRRREEHGSAKWGNPDHLRRKYAAKPESENLILTQNVALGLDGRKHRRNLNVLVCGGSGAGKTRFYAKPSAPLRAA